MERAKDIIEVLAVNKVVEHMIMNITGLNYLKNAHKDLSQMVYVILLCYDKDKIIKMNEERQLRYFIARIILNQYRSKNSEYFKLYHKFQDVSVYMGLGDPGLPAIDMIRMSYVPRIMQGITPPIESIF